MVKGRADPPKHEGLPIEEFIFRYRLQCEPTPAMRSDRLLEVVRAILAHVLDVVVLYDKQGNTLEPHRLAFVREPASQVCIWASEATGACENQPSDSHEALHCDDQ